MKKNRKYRDIDRFKAAFVMHHMDRTDGGDYLNRCRSRLLTEYALTFEDLKRLEFDAVTSVAGRCCYARKAF